MPKDRARSPSRRNREHNPRNSRSRSPKRDRRKRSPVLTNKTLSFLPSNWSRDELLEKTRAFSVFTVDKTTGCCTLEIKERRLVPDDLVVLKELFSRYTETQHISITYSYLDDETLAAICLNAQSLRHLKSLVLTFNVLSSKSVDTLIDTYSRATRKLEKLDVRENPEITVEDAYRLCFIFQSTIQELNGIDVMSFKREKSLVFDVSDHRIRLPEVKIICTLLEDAYNSSGGWVEELKLSHNFIDSKGLILITEVMKAAPGIRSLDLSYNPLTGSTGEDLSGIKELLKFCRENRQIKNVKVDGNRIPKYQLDCLMRSLQVNRTIPERDMVDMFSTHVKKYFQSHSRPMMKNHLENWTPKFTVDIMFTKLNKLPTYDAAVDPNDPNCEILLRQIKATQTKTEGKM